MRRRITFEEAANLGQKQVVVPARFPNHADVHGNPIYQQFMRLTQVYEEDELKKRQDDMADLAARMGDPRLGNGYRVPPPRTPQRTQTFNIPDQDARTESAFGTPSGANSVMDQFERMSAEEMQAEFDRQMMAAEQEAGEEQSRQTQVAQAARNAIGVGAQMAGAMGQRGFEATTRLLEDAQRRIENTTGAGWQTQGIASALALATGGGIAAGLIGPQIMLGTAGVATGAGGTLALLRVGEWLSRTAINRESLLALGDMGSRVREAIEDVYTRRLAALQDQAQGSDAEALQASRQYQREAYRQELIQRALRGDEDAARLLRQQFHTAEAFMTPEQIRERTRLLYMDLFPINVRLALLNALWSTVDYQEASANAELAKTGSQGAQEALRRAVAATRNHPRVQETEAEAADISRREGPGSRDAFYGEPSSLELLTGRPAPFSPLLQDRMDAADAAMRREGSEFEPTSPAPLPSPYLTPEEQDAEVVDALVKIKNDVVTDRVPGGADALRRGVMTENVKIVLRQLAANGNQKAAEMLADEVDDDPTSPPSPTTPSDEEPEPVQPQEFPVMTPEEIEEAKQRELMLAKAEKGTMIRLTPFLLQEAVEQMNSQPKVPADKASREKTSGDFSVFFDLGNSYRLRLYKSPRQTNVQLWIGDEMVAKVSSKAADGPNDLTEIDLDLRQAIYDRAINMQPRTRIQLAAVRDLVVEDKKRKIQKIRRDAGLSPGGTPKNIRESINTPRAAPPTPVLPALTGGASSSKAPPALPMPK